MKLDETLSKILHNIIIEVEAQHGIRYSLEEIHNVVESQLNATELGVAKGLTVHWTGLGKFIYTDKANRQKFVFDEINKAALLNPDITTEEIEQITKDLVISSKIYKQNKIREGSLRNKVGNKSIEELKELPRVAVSDTKKFKFINLIGKKNVKH